MAEELRKKYNILPTLRQFHESGAQIRCIVGPVGSGKTTAATFEICELLPKHLLKVHGIKHTRWCIVRNTYMELRDTTQKTVFEWFPFGDHKKQENVYTITYPDDGPIVEIMFRSCDRADDVAKFKSLDLTGYWIDESIEVPSEVKRMLKNRIGRYPQKCPVRFGIETTNPPDVEHETYKQFKWVSPPPGPTPEGEPLPNHVGFWQPPRENEKNLRHGYYADMMNDYRDSKDWIDMYIDGKPGMVVKGRLVYPRFNRAVHVADGPLIWAKGDIIRGWDNSGNCPACLVCQVAPNGQLQILREFASDVNSIVDFTRVATIQCNLMYPDSKYIDYGDPAGANKYSTKSGGFTSNAQLMSEACGVTVMPSEQNLSARINSVDGLLQRRDGILIDPSCTRLINGFSGGYHYKEIGTTGIFQESPEKNRFSHIHDALQYIAVKVYKSQPVSNSVAVSRAPVNNMAV